jgi:hypothetical protein
MMPARGVAAGAVCFVLREALHLPDDDDDAAAVVKKVA